MILTLSIYLYSYQPLLKQNDDKNRIILPLPDSELYGTETKKISKYTLSQGHGAHFKLLKIALLCYLTKKILCPD